MKKLALNLDDLAVDSFETAETEAARGTVQGYNLTTTVETLRDYAKTWLIACDA